MYPDTSASPSEPDQLKNVIEKTLYVNYHEQIMQTFQG